MISESQSLSVLISESQSLSVTVSVSGVTVSVSGVTVSVSGVTVSQCLRVSVFSVSRLLYSPVREAFLVKLLKTGQISVK